MLTEQLREKASGAGGSRDSNNVMKNCSSLALLHDSVIPGLNRVATWLSVALFIRTNVNNRVLSKCDLNIRFFFLSFLFLF